MPTTVKDEHEVEREVKALEKFDVNGICWQQCWVAAIYGPASGYRG